MKYIGYWEFDLRDWDKAFELDEHISATRRENPKDFPEIVLGAHFIGGSNKGLTIFETDDPKELLNVSLRFVPVLTWKFIPLYSATESAELRKKMK